MHGDRSDPRDLMDQWLRALTILGETDKSPQARLDLIRDVNKPGRTDVTITTPLQPEEQRALTEAFAALNDLRSRQTGMHLMVEETLTGWLAEATGQTRAEIVQKLALAMDALMPPRSR